jgi:hypothetical protein
MPLMREKLSAHLGNLDFSIELAEMGSGLGTHSMTFIESSPFLMSSPICGLQGVSVGAIAAETAVLGI